MKLTIHIDKALAALEKNLSEHIEEYHEARTGWIEKVKSALDDFRDAVDRKGVQASHDKLYQLMHARPRDLRSNYSKFIGALKIAMDSGETTIAIDEDDYDQIFNDSWDWARQGRMSNSTYSAKAASKLD